MKGYHKQILFVYTPLIRLAKGGFIFQCIQSAFCFSRNSLILLRSFSLMHFASSFLALTNQMDITFPLLPMNCLNARMNESVFVISIWIARLAKHVKSASYRFKVVLLSLISDRKNMSTPQWVNCGSSFVLSGGKLRQNSLASSNIRRI